jgi:hypothetical protein
MNTCIVDQLNDDHEPPTQETIERARALQLAALKELRRRLMRRSELFAVHSPAA